MSEDVSLEDVFGVAFESRWLDLHKAGPARVESYDAQANTVTVTPVLSRQLPTDDDDVVVEDLPQIPDVRIAWPRAGGFAITFPIQKGDQVLLVFCDAPLGAWRKNGQPGDPGDPERHGLSGAVAIPGVYPDADNIAGASTSNMILGRIGTPAAQIEITSSEVHLGAGATSFIALADKVDSELAKIATTLGSLSGGAAAAAVFGTAYVRAPGASVAASTSRAK